MMASWLRGVDLNHRPLGYEPNATFLLVCLLSCSSRTYLILFGLVVACLGVVFLATGSRFGSGLGPSRSVVRPVMAEGENGQSAR